MFDDTARQQLPFRRSPEPMSALGNAYLDLAERVLLGTRRPMAPKEILDHAFIAKIVPGHLHGRTQHKTLQARLSEDISRYLENSRFVRTAPGKFFLNSLRADPAIPEAFKGRYQGPRRRKELRRDRVLAMYLPALTTPLLDGFLPIGDVTNCLAKGEYRYLFWKEIVQLGQYTPVHSFVVVHREDEVLSYRCGKFSPETDPIHGMRSIGFGGAVLSTDADFLYESFFGVVSNGINELVYGLGLPRRLAEDARYSNLLLPQFGALLVSPKTHLRYLHLVLSYKCPDDFVPTKRSLSLNDVRWISVWGGMNNIQQYDQTSRYLFDQRLLTDIVSTAR